MSLPSISIFSPRRIAGVLLASAFAVATLHAVDRSRLGGGGKDDFLTGDWSGRRTAWSASGFNLGFDYTFAAYENVSGGLGRGGAVEGTADLNLDFDLGKAAGWHDAVLHVSGVAAHGTSISTRFIGDVNKVSSYFIDRGVYLHEVWLQQAWLQNKLTLRVGKLSADFEYPIYSYADTIPLPLYPTGALGARLYYEPNSVWFFSAAVYDGNPNDPATGTNPHGLHGLRLGRSEGATSIAMVGVNHDYGENAPLPSGTWKLGVYHSTRDYADVTTGALHRGNLAFFLNGDQTIWRENPKVKDDAQGLALYVVGEYAPPDRNSYHYGYGGGPYYTGLLPGRDQDVAYLNFLYTRFSQPYAAASRAAGGPDYFFENRWQFYYQVVFTKYFSITPEIDWVIRPAGTGRIPDAVVFSLRTNISF